MKPARPTSESLLTSLLLMSDGSVLADNLTPAMAAVLHELGLRADPATQSSRSRDPAGKTVVNRCTERDTGKTQ